MQFHHLYCAHRSNLRRAQMERLCPGHHFLGIARLAAHRLAFTLPDEEWQGGVADLVPAGGSEVWGALYSLSAPDLAALDAYEGFHPGSAPTPDGYLRRLVDVENALGETIRGVWTYFVFRPCGHEPPSEFYRQALLAGAQERGLPPSYLNAMRAAFEGPSA